MQRALAEMLPRAVKDPRVGKVTITAVTMAADMGSARIFFLPFGTRHSGDEALAGLRSAAGFLRGEVSRALGLRHAPRLEFQLDTDLERAHNLTELIDKAVKIDQVRGGGQDEVAVPPSTPPSED